MSFEKEQQHDKTPPVDPTVDGTLLPQAEQEDEMDKDKKSTWTFRFILAGLSIIGVTAIFLGHKPAWEPIGSLGEAIIIAVVLAATVDFYVKARLLKEASKDFTKYLMGYKLPDELQDRIRELMNTELYRRDVRIHYKMSQSPNNPNKFRIDVDYNFYVENPTNGKLRYAHKMDFPLHDKPTVLEMRCDSTEAEANYYLKNLAGDYGVASIVRFLGSPLWIKSRPKNQNTKYQFGIKYFYERFKNDSDYFAFDESAIEFTFRADFPDGIEFFGPETLVNERTWYSEKIFLRGQHTSFRWFEKGAADTNATTNIPNA